MDLSNLRPAEGSKQSDNFRRGRGHGSGNGKTAGKGHKGQKAHSGGGATDLVSKAVRCLYTEEFLREVSHAETLRQSLESTLALLKYSRMEQKYR